MGTYFQVLLSTIFYKTLGTFYETFLTCNIFFKKGCFLFSDKSQVEKSGDVIISFFCTIKNQKCRSNQAHSGNLTHLSSIIFL